MNGRCHCGRVTIQLSRRPEVMNLCNCSVCFKLGTMWSYYTASEVVIDGATDAYARADCADPRLHFHFCGTCGATTHWAYATPDGPDRMGVNMRLFEPAELAGIALIYGDRRNNNPPAPSGSYREPSMFAAFGATA